jgi:hypothetical protein
VPRQGPAMANRPRIFQESGRFRASRTRLFQLSRARTRALARCGGLRRTRTRDRTIHFPVGVSSFQKIVS